MNKNKLLQEVKKRLLKAHAGRLVGVVLYGSEARGEAGGDSDIDILVLLNGPVDLGRDLITNIKALYPLVLETGRPISAKPVDIEEYEKAQFPLFRNAHREGIRL